MHIVWCLASINPRPTSLPNCSNKAPVGVYIHAAWLMDPSRAGMLELPLRSWACIRHNLLHSHKGQEILPATAALNQRRFILH